jgi:hypothetical protein
MRPYSLAFLTEAAKQFAVQANVQLVISWRGGDVGTYSDTSQYGDARILSLSSVRLETRGQGTSTVGTFQFTLDDSDNILKTKPLLEGSEVWLLLILNGVSEVIARGKVAGAASWSEGKRTVSLSVESSYISTDMGYAPRLEDWTDLTPDAEGIAWPYCFGSPVHVPCHRVRKKSLGALQYPCRFRGKVYEEDTNPLGKHEVWFSKNNLEFGSDVPTSVDSSGFSKNKIYITEGAYFPQATLLTIQIKVGKHRCLFKGTFVGTVFTVTEANVPMYQNVPVRMRQPDVLTGGDVLQGDTFWLENVDYQKELRETFIYIWSLAPLLNPGVYTGNNYSPVAYVIDQYELHNNDGSLSEIICKTKNVVDSNLNETHTINEVYGIDKWGITDEGLSVMIYKELGNSKIRSANPKVKAGQDCYEIARKLMIKAEAFFWAATTASEVSIWGSDPDIYIANLIPSNAVKSVHCFVRGVTSGEKKRLIQVPSSWYEVQISSGEVQGRNVTGILFYDTLQSHGADIEDDKIYVTLESSVGPNAADILKYMIETHLTGVTVNSDAYDYAQSCSEPFPCHFALLEVADAINVIEEVAFQARIGLVFDAGVVYMRPLFYGPQQTLAINENDIWFKSMVHSTTNLADTCRKIETTWRPSYRPFDRDATQYLARAQKVYFYNNGITGNKIDHIECVIYNNKTLAQTMTNFWGYRKSFVYKTMALSLSYSAAILQPFDGLITTSSHITGVTGVIESVEIDINAHEVRVGVWLPIVVGG